jgi:hypothetical protein
MNDIFRHTDEDGDHLVIRKESDHLVFRTSDGDGFAESRVRRETALRLHHVLGEWLFPTYSGTPDTTLLEQMVRKAAEDAVSAILPLALREGAKNHPVDVPEPDRDPEPHDVGHPEPDPRCPGCTPLGCTDSSHDGPRDPEPSWDDQLFADTTDGPCATPIPDGARLFDVHAPCGYVWAMHRRPGEAAESGVLCGCMFGAADTGEPCLECDHQHRRNTRCLRRVKPRQLVGCECGHGWGVHARGGCGKYTGVLNETRCTCTRTPPSASCECGHRVHPVGRCGVRSMTGVKMTECECTRSRGVR